MATLGSSHANSNNSPSEASRSDRIHFPRRLRNRGHASAEHHHHHHRRQHAKETAQSVVPDLKAPTTLDSLFGRDRKKAETDSNKGSGHQQQVDGAIAEELKPEVLKREVQPDEVEKVKADNLQREEELRSSFHNIEELGMSSTRQLDDTYYAILEKASFLRSTVASLQELAEQSKNMHVGFQEEAEKLEKDTGQSLDGFGNFDQHERTINELIEQLQDSRKKTSDWKDRLETARVRVEAYEQRESKKQAKRRKRLHMTWSTALALFVLVVAVLVARNRQSVGRKMDSVGQQLVKLGDTAQEIASPLTSRLKHVESEDPHLQELFDGL